jgi:hypothetical protein
MLAKAVPSFSRFTALHAASLPPSMLAMCMPTCTALFAHSLFYLMLAGSILARPIFGNFARHLVTQTLHTRVTEVKLGLDNWRTDLVVTGNGSKS